MIVCDMQGTVQKYEADAEALFGWTRQEVLGKMNVGSFHVPRNVPTLVPRLLKEASVNGKFEEEVTLMRKDGSTFQAVLSVYPVIRDGKQVGFMGRTRPLGPPTAIPVGSLWFQALRAPFLIASIIPVLVGALAAWQIRTAFNLPFFLLCFLGAVFIHLGANMANDAWDFRSGNDANVHHLNPFAGGSRVLIRGVLNPRTHLAVALTFLGLGSLIGILLVTQVGWPLLWIGIFGVAVAYSYVGPPLRLAHRGLGEIAVALEFGPVTVLGTYYVLARTFDPAAIVLSISLGLLVAGILWINEVPDIPADSAVGKRTLVVRLGVPRATTVFGGIIGAAYLVLVLGVVLAGLTPWTLLALFALPLAIKPVQGLQKAGADPHALIPSNAGMIMATLATGVLLLVGLAIQAILK
ncbi:MAG: 1,4-dihydroxy-2-naphthoate octaprenyltransferase [Methanobacteriota archaeon]|nr:MAG: 1,4-dihydroxy-2-naphthoate octaprenyltransferase [Euryarchaeota archaeon]